VLLDDGVLHRNTKVLFNVNFTANLTLFLRLSNCASVSEKYFDNYQDARYVLKTKKNCGFIMCWYSCVQEKRYVCRILVEEFSFKAST